MLVIGVVSAEAGLTSFASPHGDAPPPTPVPPHGSLSPFPTSLTTPTDATVAPTLTARSALLADLTSGDVMDEKAADQPVPIASLTKIMTALIAFERTRLSDKVTVDPHAVFGRRDYGASSTLGLRAGERITVEDLLYAMMLGSANDAAVGTRDPYRRERAGVRPGHERAGASARHASYRVLFSTGLDDRGRSTARDLLRLVRAVEASMVSIASPPPGSGRSRPRGVRIAASRTATRSSGCIPGTFGPRQVRRSSRVPVSSHLLPAATGDWWRSSWARRTIRPRTRPRCSRTGSLDSRSGHSLRKGPMRARWRSGEERCRSLLEPSCPPSSRQRRSITSVSGSAPTHMRLSRRSRALAWERSSCRSRGIRSARFR